MALSLGSNSITSAKLGSTDVSRIMLGSTQVFPTVTVPTGTTRYGALTRAGEGGIPVTGSSITNVSAGSTADWQIVGGEVTPSATGEDNLPLGAVTLTFNDATTLDLNVEANSYSVQRSEIEARITSIALSTTNLFMVGPADQRTGTRIYLTPRAWTGLTIQPGNWIENSDPRLSTRPITLDPISCGYKQASTAPTTNLTLQGLVAQGEAGPDLPAVMQDGGATERETNSFLNIIDVAAPSENISVRQCEIWSRTTADIVANNDYRENFTTSRQLRALGAGRRSNAHTEQNVGLFFEENYCHDIARGIQMGHTVRAAGGAASRIARNYVLDVYQNFGTVGGCDGVDILDNYCHGTFAADENSDGFVGGTGDGPHAGTFGFDAFGGSGNTQNIRFMGNIMASSAKVREDLEIVQGRGGQQAYGTTGVKFNDPGTTDSYRNITVGFNTIVTRGIAIELSGVAADSGQYIEVFHNTVVANPDPQGGSAPLIYFTGAENVRLWNNIAVGYTTNGVEDGVGFYVRTLDTLDGYGNHKINRGSGDFGEEDYFVGTDGNGLLAGALIDDYATAYVPKPTSGARQVTPVAGALGTGLYSGNGVHSAAYMKPVAVGGSEDVATLTEWDGSTHMQLTAGGSLGGANDTDFPAILFAWEGEIDAGSSQNDFMSYQFSRVRIRRLSSGTIQLTASSDANAALIQANSSFTVLPADGKVQIAVSYDANLGRVQMVKNGILDPFVQITNLSRDTALEVDTGLFRLHANAIGANKFVGEFGRAYFTALTSFFNLETNAGLSALYASDGTFRSWGADGSSVTGTTPLVYVRGNASSIANLGSGGALSLTGGSITNSSSGGTMLSQVTQGAVTFTFASAVPARQSVDGAWVVQGPVQVTAVTPTKTGTGAATRNGLMINPLWQQDDNHAGQGWDGRDANTFVGATEDSSFPVTLNPNDVMVKAVSADHSNLGSGDADRAGYIADAAALYVVADIATVPAGTFFSPAPIGWTGRTGFDFWAADVPSAVAALPSLSVTGHASRVAYPTVFDRINKWQGMATYSLGLTQGGYQAWLLFNSGRQNDPGGSAGSNYGQFVLQHQEAAAMGIIGNEWSTAEKEAAMTIMAALGVHLLQLGSGDPDYYNKMPAGLGGHPQWEQLPVDMAVLSAVAADDTNLHEKLFSNMVLQTFLFDQPTLDRLTSHTSSTEPMDYRERPVLATNTANNTVRVNFVLGGERFRWRLNSSKQMVSTDGTVSSMVRDDGTPVSVVTNGDYDVPVVDASGFDGKTVYFESVEPYQLGEPAWCVSDYRRFFARFDIEPESTYVTNNNQWAGVALFWLAAGLTDTQRLPAIRWTEARALGWRGLSDPYETNWAEEFWTDHSASLLAGSVGAWTPPDPEDPPPPPPPPPSGDFAVNEGASDGTFSTSDGYRIWEAADGDQLVVTTGGDVSVLIVGGGAGGGNRAGGGGGAGEYVYRNGNASLTASTFTATVGSGGAAAANGANSTFAGLTALGGGAGGARSANGNAGGSGGGAGSANGFGGTSNASVGIGNAGGDHNTANGSGPGGGGGAGSAGETPSANNTPGAGGAGVASPVPGESGFYAAGGGAGSPTTIAAPGGNGGSGIGGNGQNSDGSPATAGATGTGAGGGGGAEPFSSGRTGAAGGSGAVKVWWSIT